MSVVEIVRFVWICRQQSFKSSPTSHQWCITALCSTVLLHFHWPESVWLVGFHHVTAAFGSDWLCRLSCVYILGIAIKQLLCPPILCLLSYCVQLICISTDFLKIRVHTNIIVEALIIFGKIFRFLFSLSIICRNSYLWLIYDIGAVHLIPEWNAFQCVVNIINPSVLTSPLSGRVNITIELMLTKCVVVGSKLSLHPLLKIIEVATWLPLSTVWSTVWLSRVSRDGTIDIE